LDILFDQINGSKPKYCLCEPLSTNNPGETMGETIYIVHMTV
jgi:hypothetical protein